MKTLLRFSYSEAGEFDQFVIGPDETLDIDPLDYSNSLSFEGRAR